MKPKKRQRRREKKQKTKKKTLKSLLLDFSSESEIMYIFMHKMHWCNEFFFSFFLQTLAIHTNINCLSCFIVCVHHWMVISYENVGWEVQKRSWKIQKNALAMSVSSLCRECVWILHKFVQLAITAHSRTLFFHFVRGERR